MSKLASDESRLIAAYPAHLIKRCATGDTSNWDERPFRERHSIAMTKAAARHTSRRRPDITK